MLVKQKYHRICFVWANYKWAWNPLRNLVDMTNETSLEKNDFSFASGYYLQRDFCLLFHFSAMVTLGLNMYRSCTCCHNLCRFIYIAILLYLKTIFPWISIVIRKSNIFEESQVSETQGNLLSLSTTVKLKSYSTNIQRRSPIFNIQVELFQL